MASKESCVDKVNGISVRKCSISGEFHFTGLQSQNHHLSIRCFVTRRHPISDDRPTSHMHAPWTCPHLLPAVANRSGKWGDMVSLDNGAVTVDRDFARFGSTSCAINKINSVEVRRRQPSLSLMTYLCGVLGLFCGGYFIGQQSLASAILDGGRAKWSTTNCSS